MWLMSWNRHGSPTSHVGMETVRRAARVLVSPKASLPETSVRLRSMRIAVVAPGALLDLWAEENDDRKTRTTAFVLARSSEQLAMRTAELLGRAGIEYALTGSAAAALVAPLATSIPTVRIWVSRADPTDGILNEIGAERVDSGFNLVLDTSKDDVALRFPTMHAGMNIVNPFRLYVDLLTDPQRGIEQANHLREQVIGW